MPPRFPTLTVQSGVDGATRHEEDSFRALTQAESDLGLDIFDIAYPPGDVRRYGADPFGIQSSSAAFQIATNTGHPVIIPEGTFVIDTTITYTGKVQWLGQGEKSILRCDGDVLLCTNGSGSRVSNLYMENITAPWIITRDPTDWAADISATLAQSNGDGYMPTPSDEEIWPTLTSAQQNQTISPRLCFQGDPYASTSITNIEVSRIYGRFVRVELYGASRSTVRDCNFRGGCSFAGGIVFWNVDRPAGAFNKAINNHVRFASHSGVVFGNNTDGIAEGNVVELCGESGIKTWQNAGYSCVNMTIANNKCNRNYYDGIDASSRFPLDDSQVTSHLILSNECFGNGGNGLNADGKRNSYIGNKFWGNYKHGIWGLCSDSLIEGNFCFSNNVAADPTYHEILGGNLNNAISNNRIWMDNGGISSAIYATNAHVISSNYATGGSFNFGAYPGVYANNVDVTSGLLTEQSFVLTISNNGGTIEHAIYAQAGAAALGNYQSRINGASASPTATPTGADASTAMAGGGKISSAAARHFWFDTSVQVPAHALMVAPVIYNSTGTAVTVRPQMASININGVTRHRLLFEFLNATSAASFDLNTSNIGSGAIIQVQFYGRLS